MDLVAYGFDGGIINLSFILKKILGTHGFNDGLGNLSFILKKINMVGTSHQIPGLISLTGRI